MLLNFTRAGDRCALPREQRASTHYIACNRNETDIACGFGLAARRFAAVARACLADRGANAVC